MPKGKFSATDDFNMNGHHLLDWRYLSDMPQGGATEGQVLTWNGKAWAPADSAGGGGDLDAHLADYANPHNVSLSQISGIGEVALLRTGDDWHDYTLPDHDPAQPFTYKEQVDPWDTILIEDILTHEKAASRAESLPINTRTQVQLNGKASTEHLHSASEIIPDPTPNLVLTTGDGTESVWEEFVDPAAEYTQEPSGFVNLTDSTVTVSAAVRTLYIFPTVGGTPFRFYDKGVPYEKSALESVVFTDVEGMHAIYYDGDTLTAADTFDPDTMILQGALVAVLYWDAVNKAIVYQGDERHGIQMDGATHKWIHTTQGTQYLSGHSLTDLLTDQNGSLDTHAQMGVALGTITDEDIVIDAGVAATPASIPVIYLEGASQLWRRATATTFPVITYSGGSSLLAWNEYTGGAWQQTEVTSGRYVLSHIVRTNDPNTPYMAVQGQNTYVNKADARLGANTELGNLYTVGLPFAEFIFLGTVIYQTKTSFTNTPQAITVTTDEGDDYVDWRSNSPTPGSGPGDHGSLGGLADPDHPLSALQDSGAATGQGMTWSGTAWVPDDLADAVHTHAASDITAGTFPATTEGAYEVKDGAMQFLDEFVGGPTGDPYMRVSFPRRGTVRFTNIGTPGTDHETDWFEFDRNASKWGCMFNAGGFSSIMYMNTATIVWSDNKSMTFGGQSSCRIRFNNPGSSDDGTWDFKTGVAGSAECTGIVRFLNNAYTPTQPTDASITNVRLRVQASSTTLAKYIELQHDNTDGVITVGSGKLLLKPAGGSTEVTGTLAVSSTVDLNGSVNFSTHTTAVDYTLAGATRVWVDASTPLIVSVEISLPSASAVGDGREYTIKKIDSTAIHVNINRAGSDTIEGVTTVALISRYKYLTLCSDGSSTWYIVGQS